MLHKVKSVYPLPDRWLSVRFCEGVTKCYDTKPLSAWRAEFRELDDVELFNSVGVDAGGYGIVWNDRLDLSCDELYANGAPSSSPFDGLMSFADATELWGLHESTLRKAVGYGKLIDGVDVCKFGKQWVVSTEAMRREYGEPRD